MSGRHQPFLLHRGRNRLPQTQLGEIHIDQCMQREQARDREGIDAVKAAEAHDFGTGDGNNTHGFLSPGRRAGGAAWHFSDTREVYTNLCGAHVN